MTEKRFINVEVDDYYNLICVNDGDTFHSYSEKALEDLLNELSDEYKQLKEDNEYLEKRFKEEEWHYDHIDEDRDVWKYKCQELEKENELLKSTINTLTHDNTKMKKVLNTTKNENEQIKQVIKEAYNNERTHIGRNVLKQLLNNIGETNE